jgi:single-strand DNA-binding protein
MNSLNSVLLEGTLAGEPGFSYSSDGIAHCSFCLKVNYTDLKTKVKETYFFNINTFTRLAEVCGEYLHKGRGVRVIGRLVQSTIVDSESGVDHARVYIHAEHVEFKP